MVSTADAVKPGGPRVYDECPDNIPFTEFIGDKAACDAGFAKAAHVVKHRFVINRVTAACMEPRGTVAHYTAGDRRYTVYTPTQRPHGFRAELAGILKVPRKRGACHHWRHRRQLRHEDAGVQRDAAGLLRVQTHRPAGKMDQHAHRSFPVRRAGARQRHRRRTGPRQRRPLPRACASRRWRRLGAYLQPNMPAYFLNAGTLAGTYRTPAIFVDTSGVFTNTNPVRPYRGNGRPEAAFVIERMVEVAARELKIDSAELRRRNYVSPKEMPFKTGLTFTYDCGEFEKNMDLAMELADFAGFDKRRKEARKRGKLRGIGLSNTIERAAAPGTEGAEVRFDKSAPSPCLSARTIRARATRPFSSRSSPTSSGSIPTTSATYPATPTRCSMAKAPAARAPRRWAARPSLRATEKVIEKATAIVAHALKVDPADVKFADGVFSSAKTNRTMTIKEIASDAQLPAKIPADMEPGLGSPPPSTRRRSTIIRTAATSAKSRSTSRPASPTSCAITWSTTSAPCSIRCCCMGRSTAASRKASGRR